MTANRETIMMAQNESTPTIAVNNLSAFAAEVCGAALPPSKPGMVECYNIKRFHHSGLEL